MDELNELTKINKKCDKLLILDIDGTLIHTEKYPHDDDVENNKYDFSNYEFVYYKRPHLDKFLSWCLNKFEVAIWTAASLDYASFVIENLFQDSSQLKFIFTSLQTTNTYNAETSERRTIKNLKKIKNKGYNLEKVIIVDDTASTFCKNYGNAIKINPYFGSDSDNELEYLMIYLNWLSEQPNVRIIDKIKWKDQVKNHLSLI